MRILQHDEKGFQRLLQWLGCSLDERDNGSAAFRSRGAIVMTDSDKIFSGSIPEIYDSTLVPLIFEAYAADLARRVAEGKPVAVLETAAGSGVVTRALVPLLGAAARYVVTDLNPPMLVDRI